MKKIFIFLVLIGIILMTPWMIISFVTRDVIFSSIESVPNKKYGLLLGTSPGSKGRENPFFRTRIEAARELYERGKIEYILVSGDNSSA